MKNIAALTFLSCLIFTLSSCLKQKHTSYNFLIINNSSETYFIDYDSLGTHKTKPVYPCEEGSLNTCLISIFQAEYLDEVLPEYTQNEFNSIVKDVEVYMISETGEHVHYNDTVKPKRELSNWQHEFSEDDQFGNHIYQYRLSD